MKFYKRKRWLESHITGLTDKDKILFVNKDIDPFLQKLLKRNVELEFDYFRVGSIGVSLSYIKAHDQLTCKRYCLPFSDDGKLWSDYIADIVKDMMIPRLDDFEKMEAEEALRIWNLIKMGLVDEIFGYIFDGVLAKRPFDYGYSVLFEPSSSPF